MHRINSANWTYCRFKKGDSIAFISFGADPESIEDDRLHYYVTVLKAEIHETFQQVFPSLSHACLYLNSYYADWTFEDQMAPKSGCSTCAAH
jgi:hypothetical protein